MIRSLRRKFIVIAMLSLPGTMAVLCTAIGIGSHYAVADRAIDLLYQNNGAFPRPDGPVNPSRSFRFQVTSEPPFGTRCFIVEPTDRQEISNRYANGITTFTATIPQAG